jgi:hypothetical protein
MTGKGLFGEICNSNILLILGYNKPPATCS